MRVAPTGTGPPTMASMTRTSRYCRSFCKVMKPLANCLDRLQTEENAYLGVLLPTLTLMRVALERMEEARGDQALTYAKPLVRALLRQEGNKGGFNNRFSAMFKDLDLLMASALHPNYGMTTFNSVAPNMKEESSRGL
ncbi:hypothetical protein GWK47_028558 [Chionoecetes opilio]|uniref:Uncharacterized protein n=1 Tax=Chionoecetes opilio TaxID=41210 RepID=A0A8J5CRY4_CHIOP|nr:hypothetical protein GWK47_028558 [Chionoecetes opilio]